MKVKLDIMGNCIYHFRRRLNICIIYGFLWINKVEQPKRKINSNLTISRFVDAS